MAWQSVTVVAGKPTKAIELNTVQANITAQANGDAGAPKQQKAGMDTNSVGQDQVETDAIHTDEISSSPIEITSDPGGTGSKVVGIGLDTTDELFFPLNKMIDNGGAGSSADIDKFETANSASFDRRVVCSLDTTGFGNTPGITIRATKIDSSPPWDIGDGPIPFFTYAEIDSSGRAISVWTSKNPPWDVYSFAENILKKKLTSDEIYEKYGVEKSEIGRGRKYKLKRSIANYKTGEISDEIVEIDSDFKNKHMESRANPFSGWTEKDSNNNIATKKTTIVLIDPCETLSLLNMSEGGYSINDMIIGKNKELPRLKISNNYMSKRETPHPDIKIIPLSWV